MKKILAVLAVIVIACTAFAACSKNEDATTTVVHETAVQIETEEAKIKESDAIDFIKNAYTEKELGLDGADGNYSFMIASSGVEIDGEKYVRVVANNPVKNDTTNEDGKETYRMETLGEYYISFDGKKVLMKNSDGEGYTELENRYDDYSAKGETVSESESETQKDEKD